MQLPAARNVPDIYAAQGKFLMTVSLKTAVNKKKNGG